mgnify:CR=1 FL=1
MYALRGAAPSDLDTLRERPVSSSAIALSSWVTRPSRRCTSISARPGAAVEAALATGRAEPDPDHRRCPSSPAVVRRSLLAVVAGAGLAAGSGRARRDASGDCGTVT